MRKKFPRVASRTRPKPAKPPVVKLPPLCCSVYKNGSLVGIAEIPDPRVLFVKSYSEQGAKWGYSAKPITTRRQLLAARKMQAMRDVISAARKAVANG